MKRFKTGAKSCQGFTLTELAIVLCGAGLVMAAVWSIVGVVWNSYRLYNTKDQIVTVVKNVRDYYGPIGGLYTNSVTKAAEANGTDITQTLNDDDHRLIPVEMRLNPSDDTSEINHALNAAASGSFHAFSEAHGRTLRIQLLRVSQANCIKMLMEFPLLLPEMGVTRIQANGNNTNVNIANVADPGDGVTLPMTITTASSWCSETGDAGNEVVLDFKVQN